jgi:hypothetical protein
MRWFNAKNTPIRSSPRGRRAEGAPVGISMTYGSNG